MWLAAIIPILIILRWAHWFTHLSPTSLAVRTQAFMRGPSCLWTLPAAIAWPLLLGELPVSCWVGWVCDLLQFSRVDMERRSRWASNRVGWRQRLNNSRPNRWVLEDGQHLTTGITAGQKDLLPPRIFLKQNHWKWLQLATTFRVIPSRNWT